MILVRPAINFLKNERAKSRVESRFHPLGNKGSAPIWILLLVASGLYVNGLIPSSEVMKLRFQSLGIVLFVLGMCTDLFCVIIFFRMGTEIIPASSRNKHLLVDGPYKITRNPMYVGMIFSQFGIAFYIGTIPMFLVPVVFICLINFVFIPFEEAKMLRQFGEQYLDYKRRVRRWI